MDDFNNGIYQLSEDDVDEMNLEELCEYLSSNNLDTKGSLSELVQRFKAFLNNVPVQQKLIEEPLLKVSTTKAGPIESTGQEALLAAASQINRQKLSRPSSLLDYKYEMNQLKTVVEKIKNQNSEPSATDMILLQQKAKDLIRRMPIFVPKYPGFHQYRQKDSIAQAYIKYLPKEFHHEKFVAIRTNPNGRKCP